jgi:hypothetical protein
MATIAASITNSGGALNPISFNGAYDTNGSQWVLSSADGWEAPGVRQTFHPRLGVSGEAIGEANLAGWTVALTGSVIATSNTLAWIAHEALSARCQSGVGFGVRLTINGRYLDPCYVVDPLKVAWLSDIAFNFQVGLKAPIPTKS